MTQNKSQVFNLLLFFALAGSLSWSATFYDMYQLPKGLAVFFAVFFTLLYIAFRGSPEKFRLNSALPALYFLYCCAWLIFSPNHPPFYYGLLFFSPILYFTAYYSTAGSRTLAEFVNALLLLSLLYGLYQFFSSKTAVRPYSFFGNPIFFAEFIGFCLPFTLYSLVSKDRPSVLGLICSLLAMPALIAASSRGALISIGVSISIFVFSCARMGTLKRLMSPAIAAIAVVLLIPFLSHDFIASARSGFARASVMLSMENPAIQNRLDLGASSFDIFCNSPLFGAGPGAVKKYQQLKQASILKNRPQFKFVNSSYAHNDYIQLLAETGVAGLLLYAAFLFWLAHTFEQASPRMGQDAFLFSVSLFSSVIFIASESFFNFPLFSFPGPALLFIAGGLIMRECRDFTPEGRVVPVKYVRITAALMLILAAVYIFAIKPGAIASNFYLKEAVKQDYSGNAGCAALYEKSISLEKDSYFSSFHYAQFLAIHDNYPAALERYGKLLAMFPYSADIMYNMGSVYLARDNYGAALQYFSSALFYYPDFALAHLGSYRALTALKLDKEAQSQLEEAILSDKDIVNNSQSGKVILFKEATYGEK